MTRFNSTTRRQENKELFGRFCETYYPVSTDFRHGPCPIFVEGLFAILDRIDPAYYCDEVGACGPNQRPTLSGDNNVIAGSDAPFCTICADVVEQAKRQLDDPKVIDDVHRKVDAFCEYLTVIDADKQCRAALDSYIDQAVDFVKNLNSKDFCRSLQLCSASTSTKKQQPKILLPTLADFNNFGLETSVQVGGKEVKSVDETITNTGSKSPNCLFCKTFIKEMFKFLKENRTEANIRDALDRGCALIYHDKEKLDHCEDLVGAYTKELLELLADETNPEMICVLLEQCTYQTMKPSRVPSKSFLGQSLRRMGSSKDNDSPVTISQLISMLDPTVQLNSMRTCVECKLFFKYLQEQLEEKTSQEEIKNWLLNNLCASLGDQNLADSCAKLINQESAVFFKAVVESLDPKKSCQQLGACSSRVRTDYLIQLQKQMATLQDLMPTGLLVKQPSAMPKPICDQCVQIVTSIDDYLSTHPIDHDISVLKDKVCNTIQDDNLRGECIMIIQTFGQEIIQAISNMDNPRQLCQKISLCSASN